MVKEELCIMPENDKWSTERFNNLERHEAFFGIRNRQKSIDDGLIVFLTPEMHREQNGVHGKNGHEFNMLIKKTAQKVWQEYYGKTTEEFRQRYGKNYL